MSVTAQKCMRVKLWQNWNGDVWMSVVYRALIKAITKSHITNTQEIWSQPNKMFINKLFLNCSKRSSLGKVAHHYCVDLWLNSAKLVFYFLSPVAQFCQSLFYILYNFYNFLFSIILPMFCILITFYLILPTPFHIVHNLLINSANLCFVFYITYYSILSKIVFSFAV